MKTLKFQELIQIIENSLYDEDIYITFCDNSTEIFKGVMYTLGAYEIKYKSTYKPLFEKFLKSVLDVNWWEITINDVEYKVVE